MIGALRVGAAIGLATIPYVPRQAKKPDRFLGRLLAGERKNLVARTEYCENGQRIESLLRHPWHG